MRFIGAENDTDMISQHSQGKHIGLYENNSVMFYTETITYSNGVYSSPSST